jgi:hypothetical protein
MNINTNAATIVDPTLEVGGGETCATLSDAASSLEADEFLCTDVALAAQIDCCPTFNMTTVDEGSIINPTFNETSEDDGSTTNTTSSTACSLCANGLTVSENTVIPYAEANGSTCAETLAYAQNIVASSDICTTMKNAEAVCCPEPSSDPCQVCVDGITVDGSTPIFDGAVKTCGDVTMDALIVESSSDVCTQMKLAETVCCSESVVNATEAPSSAIANETASLAPSITPSLNSTSVSTNETEATNMTTCEVCLDGITAGNENIVIGEGKTCGDLIADALLTDANDVGCSMMQDAQLTCCPTPAEVPCDVCPDGGITVDEGTAITVAKTCGDLMVDALNTELESDICSGMKAVAEPICCPTNTTAPTMTPEMNSTTVSPSLATTVAPSTAEDANVTESLAPSTSTTTTVTSTSPESSSSTNAPTVLSGTTPSPSLVATSTEEEEDEEEATSPSPTSLAPSSATAVEEGGLEPTDKEPLAFESGGGEPVPMSSGISNYSFTSRCVGIVAIGWWAMIASLI